MATITEKQKKARSAAHIKRRSIEGDSIIKHNASSNVSKRGPYLKPLRDKAITEICRLIIDENYTPAEVMAMLKIPERTFQRYMHQAFETERRVLTTKLTDDEILNQMVIMEGRFTKARREIINATKDPNMDPRRLTAIVNAYHLSEELAAGIWKIYSSVAPAVLQERHSYFLRHREEVIKKLELLKQEEEDEDEDIEEYNEFGEKEKEKESRGEWDDFDEESDDNYHEQERRES